MADADVTLAQSLHPQSRHPLPRPLVGGTEAGAGAMRDQTFRGVRHALVLAQYGPEGEIAGGAESDALCAEVLAVARDGAPVPVACSRIGDPALADGAALIVIVQASVTRVPAAGDRLFAVSARAHFAGGLEPEPLYFGAAPLVVRYAETPAGRADRAQAIDAALHRILPWRRVGDAGVR